MSGNYRTASTEAERRAYRQKIEDILQAAIFVPRDEPLEIPGDDALIAAEKEIQRLQPTLDIEPAHSDLEGEHDRVLEHHSKIADFILETPPAGPAGALVILRILMHRGLGSCRDSLSEVEAVAVRNLTAYLEREAKARRN